MEPRCEELAELLRRTAPRPREAFVDELEDSLMRSLARPRTPTLRVPRLAPSRRLLAASAVGAALAGLLALLSVAGALPLGVGGADDAAAGRDCVSVMRWQLERRPAFEVGADGRMHLQDRTRLVPRPVERCH
jgi:hypothetical protein